VGAKSAHDEIRITSAGMALRVEGYTPLAGPATDCLEVASGPKVRAQSEPGLLERAPKNEHAGSHH
jgi:hypothetical protein